MTLGVYLSLTSQQCRRCWASGPARIILVCSIKAELWVAGRLEHDVNMLGYSQSYGHGNFLGRSATTFSELVSPLLVDGCLRVRAVIQGA